jgi:uncharacterized phiE125 gp8 family phage protein
MRLVAVTGGGPVVEPVDVVTFKTHARIDISDDDYVILGQIQAAREHAETFTRRAFITQTWDLKMDAFPPEGEIEIPLAPLQSVTSIKYYDSAGVQQTWSSTNYVVLKSVDRGVIRLAVNVMWPATQVRADAVEVRFVAGYGDTQEVVPAAIRSSILMLAAELYKNREQSVSAASAAPALLGAMNLLNGYRSLRIV